MIEATDFEAIPAFVLRIEPLRVSPVPASIGAKEQSMRKYKSGTVWCVWRWTDVNSEYITRLHLVKAPWFAICLHWFHKPDPEPFDHDHPVTFLSLIVRGQYTEQRNGVLKTRRWFNFIRASDKDQHTIVALKGKPMSLCLMGPKRREWGFHRPDGWIGWKAYYAALKAPSA